MTTHEQVAQDLPLYALGTLADDERRSVEEHLHECARCRFELHLLHEDMGRLSLSGPEVGLENLPLRELPPMITLDNAEPAPRPAPRLYWLAAIPVILSIVLGAMLVQLRTQNMELNQAKATSQADLAAERNHSERSRLIESVLHDSATVHFANTASAAQIQVLFNPSVHHAIILANRLPRPNSPQVYQLWLLPVASAPLVAAGTFVPDAHGNVFLLSPLLPSDLQVAGFQITIEDQNNAISTSNPAVYSGK